MGPRSINDIRKSLLKKGFVQVKGRRRHQTFCLYVNGKPTRVMTHYSHSANECGDDILHLMANQLHLTRQQMNALIDCQMDYEEYVGTLQDRGVLWQS
jgi:hypothetical protein